MATRKPVYTFMPSRSWTGGTVYNRHEGKGWQRGPLDGARVRVLDRDDNSPVQVAADHAGCELCALGAIHSEAAHAWNIEASKQLAS